MGSSGVPIPSQYGGAVERHIYDLARFLTKRNCEVHVLTMRIKNAAKQQIVEDVYIHRGGFFQENPSTERALLKHLTFFCYVLIKLLLMKTDIIHAHNGLPGLAAILVSKVRRIPFVFTSHTPYLSVGHQIFSEGTMLKKRFDDLQVILEKFCAGKASFTIVVSKTVRDGLVSIGVSKDRIFLVPNGVDTRKFKEDFEEATRVRQKFQLGKNKVVLYVGRIVRYKGLDYLVDSAPKIAGRHPDVRFVIAGPVSYYQTGALTPYYRELREKIELRQLSEFFVFTGTVDEKDLLGLYSACDMLVLPSFSEAFGMVLAEAMSCGKPVIGNRIGGIVDVINDGKNGYLVSPAQPEEIASKINYLLERPVERKRMGRTARKHVEEMFDWNILAARIIEIYRDAIREKKKE